jgi:hypothetical protein
MLTLPLFLLINTMDALHTPSFLIGLVTSICIFVVFFGALRLEHMRYRNAAPGQNIEQQAHPRDIAEQLGLSPEELRFELSHGKSMMDIARERGVELRLPPRWVDDEGRQEFLRRMAERIGISEEELRGELSTGKRLLDVAAEHDVSLDLPATSGHGDPPQDLLP